MSEIDIDQYRYQNNTKGTYSVLIIKNYTNICAPEFLSEIYRRI